MKRSFLFIGGPVDGQQIEISIEGNAIPNRVYIREIPPMKRDECKNNIVILPEEISLYNHVAFARGEIELLGICYHIFAHESVKKPIEKLIEGYDGRMV